MNRPRPALHAAPPLDAGVEGVHDAVPTDLDTLYRRYASYVAAVAHRLLGRDADVDDAVQEVFVAAVRGIGNLRDPRAVKGWLARVCVRTAHRRLQRRRLRARLGFGETVSYENVADAAASPEDRALLSRVYRALDDIPAAERIAWTLRHVEGERLDDIANITSCSLATVKRRISAASARLEELLSDD